MRRESKVNWKERKRENSNSNNRQSTALCVSCLSTGESRSFDILRTIESCTSFGRYWYWCLDNWVTDCRCTGLGYVQPKRSKQGGKGGGGEQKRSAD